MNREFEYKRYVLPLVKQLLEACSPLDMSVAGLVELGAAAPHAPKGTFGKIQGAGLLLITQKQARPYTPTFQAALDLMQAISPEIQEEM